MSHHDQHDDKENHGNHHILSNKISRRTIISLFILTVITVAVSQIDLGQSLNFTIAMLIASTKALIVTMFFMGLKYDTNESRGFFYSSIIFVGIYFVLTASDVFTRPDGWQVGTQDVYLTAKSSGPESKTPWISSPELLAHGKKTFEANCVSCHGAEGKGDGIGGAALPKKPRNFHSADGWVNARRGSAIFKMFNVGVPPFMPPYGHLPETDRWALAHFVLSLGPTPEADDAKSLAAIGIDPNAAPVAAAPARHIPVDFALERYVKSSGSK